MGDKGTLPEVPPVTHVYVYVALSVGVINATKCTRELAVQAPSQCGIKEGVMILKQIPLSLNLGSLACKM